MGLGDQLLAAESSFSVVPIPPEQGVNKEDRGKPALVSCLHPGRSLSLGQEGIPDDVSPGAPRPGPHSGDQACPGKGLVSEGNQQRKN